MPAMAGEVVVVGGGLAGIATALAAADGGARVTLLEARPRLGGATFSFQREGLELDNGQHVYLRCCRAYQSLLERLGVRELAPLQPRLDVPVLAPGGRMRRLDPADQRLDQRSFGSWLAGQGQSRAATDALWELVGLPTLNARTDQASLQLATMVFKTGLLTARDAADIGYSRVPLSRLHGEPAARALGEAGVRVRMRCHARAIEPADPGADGGGESRLAVRTDDDLLEADAVVVAVPHEAAGWLPARVVGPADQLERLGISPIINLHVVYDRVVTTLPFAAGLGPSRGQCLAVSLSAAHDEVELPVAALRDRYLPALAELFPAARHASVTSFFVTRERTATFLAAPGTAALRPAAETALRGLFLAGSWTSTGWPATMEGAVRSGLVAARAALRSLGRTRQLPTAEGFWHPPRHAPAVDRGGTPIRPEVAA